MENNKYQLYLADLGYLIKEEAEELIKKKKEGVELSDYDMGYQMAVLNLISLIQDQAKLFEISLSEIHLDKIDPEKDL